ncbi:MarR family winged helix-turn-helix transcriptional regulator [Ideonella azotifigens]|uniref:HTH marR-type domain-containing protein n=1 Tax=Ideonella azotifigens TaxID=513160 RepID=A0ABP3UNM1_9BURK|nr:MarR family winged helix-turn-helix transcriptional regulator [Ideonella azotifigens]MCD2344737.1 MarR family winged helix-turn-helix transcriptional regulator [Ideonella azotifigens]
MKSTQASPVSPSTALEGTGDAPAGIAFYAPGQYKSEDSVGYLMRLVMNSVMTRVDARLSALDMTHAQWLPLFKLVADKDHTMASLARELGTDPGAMTRSLDRLEAKGLLRRERSTADRRVVHLVPTDEGRAVAAQVPPVLSDEMNRHLAGFSAAEWQQLLQFLRRMIANGEALKPGCCGNVGAAIVASAVMAGTTPPAADVSG